MEKLLTIAIPTFNRKDCLRLALESIISQCDERIEVLVSDNASSDGTEEMVRRYFPMVKYYRNAENLGMKNFRLCYEKSNGRYMMLLGDDDVIVENRLGIILSFLEENPDLSLVFLNNREFNDDYHGIDECELPYFKESDDNIVTHDKNLFLDYGRYNLTQISCFILSRRRFLEVDNPERYDKNWFVHTCFAFECMKDDGAMLGVVRKVCVAINCPKKRSQYDMETIMDVFGTGMHSVFCELGVQLGLDSREMNKIYRNRICSHWARTILSFTARGLTWKKPFWEKGYPIAKQYLKAWFTIIPAAFVPAFIARMARNIKRRIIDNNRGQDGI